MEVVSNIAIGLIRCQDAMVVGTRRANQVLGQYDEFPGGKCRDHEPPEDAVVRECREETGLGVSVVALRMACEHEYAHGRLRLYFFDCVPDFDGPFLPPVRPPFRWVGIGELGQLQFPAANERVLATLRKSH